MPRAIDSSTSRKVVNWTQERLDMLAYVQYAERIDGWTHVVVSLVKNFHLSMKTVTSPYPHTNRHKTQRVFIDVEINWKSCSEIVRRSLPFPNAS